MDIIQSPPSTSSSSASTISTSESKTNACKQMLRRSASFSCLSSISEPFNQQKTKKEAYTWPLRKNQVDQVIKMFDDKLDKSVIKELGIQTNKQTKNPWGNLSYSQLIEFAIESSPWKRLTLKEIYAWFTKYVPYFKDKVNYKSTMGWKNSIRHNLSLHKRFIRIDVIRGNKKRSMWTSLKYRPKKHKSHSKNKHKLYHSTYDYSQLNPYSNGLLNGSSYPYFFNPQFLPFNQSTPCFNHVASIDNKCVCPNCVAFEAYASFYSNFLKTAAQQPQYLPHQQSIYSQFLLNQYDPTRLTSLLEAHIGLGASQDNNDDTNESNDNNNQDEDRAKQSRSSDSESSNQESMSASDESTDISFKKYNYKRKLMDRYEAEPEPLKKSAFSMIKKKCMIDLKQLQTNISPISPNNNKHIHLTELLKSNTSSIKILQDSFKNKF